MSPPHRQYSHAPHHHPHDDGRQMPRRPPPPARNAPPPRSSANPHSYALVHHGKQVRVGPVVFWIITGSIVLMGAWSAATATYFAFRDDVLTRMIARQAKMQYAYEDRIAELRARIDRTTSRQLLDQEEYDQKLTQILRRQSALESRANAMMGLPDNAPTGAIRPSHTPRGLPKPSPINDIAPVATTPSDREARLDAQPSMFGMSHGRTTSKRDSVRILARLESSLDKIENRQIASLNAAEKRYDTRLQRVRGLISDLGLNMAKLEAATPQGHVGGPYIPVRAPAASASAFDKQLYRVALSRAQVDKLNHTLAMVPYRKPVVGEIELSSGFGVRNDPFVGRPAMHAGLDFRASTGDPVRATADGRVVSAGWSGGYGRMVEIDHGNGLATRYGHMSQIDVKVGQIVKIGQVVGEVGSTGRSTGPHLHYETRINGEAVDPQRFLRAGARFAQN
jgi:murein DD-endopeptidase MepM/ murein hydrolase activator NlpD